MSAHFTLGSEKFGIGESFQPRPLRLTCFLPAFERIVEEALNGLRR
jgi:hypothetical protein